MQPSWRLHAFTCNDGVAVSTTPPLVQCHKHTGGLLNNKRGCVCGYPRLNGQGKTVWCTGAMPTLKYTELFQLRIAHSLTKRSMCKYEGAVSRLTPTLSLYHDIKP